MSCGRCENQYEGSAKINGVVFRAIVVSGGIACLLLILGALARSKKPMSTALHTGVGGAAALAVVNLTGLMTGVSLSINGLTLIFTVAAGIPGVVLLMFLKLLWRV